MGNLSDKKLKLKVGDTVLVHAEFLGTEDDHHFKVKRTGVGIVEFEPLLEACKIDYERVAYKHDDTGRSVDCNHAHKYDHTDYAFLVLVMLTHSRVFGHKRLFEMTIYVLNCSTKS